MSLSVGPLPQRIDCVVLAPDGSTISPPKTSQVLGDGKTCSTAAPTHVLVATDDSIAPPRARRPVDLRDAADRLGPDWDENGRAALRAMAMTERAGNAALDGATWIVPGPETYAADVIRSGVAVAKTAAHAAPLLKPVAESLAHGVTAVGDRVGAGIKAAGDAIAHAGTSLGLHGTTHTAAVVGGAVKAERQLGGADLRAHLETNGAKRVSKAGDGTEVYVANAKGAVAGGKLTIQPGATLNRNEARVGIERMHAGDDVVALTEDRRLGTKNPDFLINGRPTELCTISRVADTDVDSAIRSAVRAKTQQAPHVIVDARGQRRFTQAAATRIVSGLTQTMPSSRLRSIVVLGRDNGRDFAIRMER